jgi:hypothetical protein
VQQLRAEIAAEVRARRAAGEYPPGFERELDALFARFAPRETQDDFDGALERVEDLTVIEPELPVASRNPALGVVKRVVAKLIGWYHSWLSQQIGTLAAALTSVMRALGTRVEQLERTSDGAAHARAVVGRVPAARDDGAWEQVVCDALAGTAGRIAVIECGSGALVAALAAHGLDVYGVEPRPKEAEAAQAVGAEVRVDDGAAHLRGVAPRVLAAVVLRGVVERAAIGDLFVVVERAVACLEPGGTLVVCSVTPDAWGTGPTIAEADLASGHPLRPETWQTVLADLGLSATRVEAAGSGAYVVIATRASA